VASFTISRVAEADLTEIADYTLQRWGQAQAEKYLFEIEACCRTLAGNPLPGRACDAIRPRLRRMERGEHVVFYSIAPDGIFIVRVVHRSMLPRRHGTAPD
jgi:toxin ParE1/3/4